jgi:hypothetical protein
MIVRAAARAAQFPTFGKIRRQNFQSLENWTCAFAGGDLRSFRAGGEHSSKDK